MATIPGIASQVSHQEILIPGPKRTIGPLVSFKSHSKFHLCLVGISGMFIPGVALWHAALTALP